jgi:hypothetical protein
MVAAGLRQRPRTPPSNADSARHNRDSGRSLRLAFARITNCIRGRRAGMRSADGRGPGPSTYRASEGSPARCLGFLATGRLWMIARRVYRSFSDAPRAPEGGSAPEGAF